VDQTFQDKSDQFQDLLGLNDLGKSHSILSKRSSKIDSYHSLRSTAPVNTGLEWVLKNLGFFCRLSRKVGVTFFLSGKPDGTESPKRSKSGREDVATGPNNFRSARVRPITDLAREPIPTRYASSVQDRKPPQDTRLARAGMAVSQHSATLNRWAAESRVITKYHDSSQS
jgi:hypothetical protein